MKKINLKQIRELSEEELLDNPLAMYIYAVEVIKEKLPSRLHSKMKELEIKKDLYAIGYFKFLNKKNMFQTFCDFVGCFFGRTFRKD